MSMKLHPQELQAGIAETISLLRAIYTNTVNLCQAWDVPVTPVVPAKPAAPVRLVQRGAGKGHYVRNPRPNNKPDQARRGATWSPKDDKTLIKLRKQGKSHATCGAVLGRSRQSCSVRYSWLRRNQSS